MEIWLKEKIGRPELFTGRKKELSYFLNLIDGIKQEISWSTALLSRRKTGKTAILQRLYNLTFNKNDGIIPFYFEIRETDQWLGKFAEEFFLTFIYQYFAFKTRDKKYLSFAAARTLEKAVEISRTEGLDYLTDTIESMRTRCKEGSAEFMWEIAREAPRTIAEYTNERIVQMIDEFQFINRFIFRDRACTACIENLAGSYLGTAEYKNAPLIVSGSWVGWLMNDLTSMLPGRFKFHYLKNISEEEAIEMILKYSHIENIPITEKTVRLMAGLTEGNPFYISTLFGSDYPKKDFMTSEGLIKTLEFETLNREGMIRGTWLEYINSAFPRINEKYAKNIVLYLSKHRDRLVSRTELKKNLDLDMPDHELDNKMDALLKSDIIEEDRFQYRGVQDNIFDKVFRSRYADDIDKFAPEDVLHEYRAMFDDLLGKYKKLSGKYNRYKGAFAEFMIIRHLEDDAFRENDFFKSMMKNLPEDFNFLQYKSVWSYNSPPLHSSEFQIDVFAEASADEYSLIGEVKNRKAKFSIKEAEEFRKKAGELEKLENTGKILLFVFSKSGFFKNTRQYLKKHKIAWSSDKRWLDRIY